MQKNRTSEFLTKIITTDKIFHLDCNCSKIHANTIWTIFILVGVLMLLKPITARAILRKAGSTNLINYSEITLRLIPASALIIYADYSEFPESFTVFGWFMFLTSVVLYFVPKKLHHDFSNKCADFLKPVYFRIISPFAVIIGVLIIKSVV